MEASALATQRPRPDAEARPGASAGKWHKLGTIERLMDYVGGPDGTPSLPEKALCVHLIRYASTADAQPRVFVAIDTLCAQLGITSKTLRAYTQTLQRRGWVEVKRDRPNGAMTFYIGGLIAAFTEDRFGKVSHSGVTSIVGRIGKLSHFGTDAENPSVRESFPIGSVNVSAGSVKLTEPDRESLPIPLDYSRELIRPHTEHTALARRLGVESDWFTDRPRRFAAAHLVATSLATWNVTERRMRKAIKQHGFTIVAGAVGYVLDQLERKDQIALIKGEDAVRNPAALFETAVIKQWSGALPGFDDDPHSPRDGGWSVDADLWATLREMLRNRIKPGTFDAGFKRAKLRCEGNAFTIVVPTTFALKIAREAEATVASCLTQIGFPGASVAIIAESGI